jgi:hypothetical protein
LLGLAGPVVGRECRGIPSVSVACHILTPVDWVEPISLDVSGFVFVESALTFLTIRGG